MGLLQVLRKRPQLFLFLLTSLSLARETSFFTWPRKITSWLMSSSWASKRALKKSSAHYRLYGLRMLHLTVPSPFLVSGFRNRSLTSSREFNWKTKTYRLFLQTIGRNQSPGILGTSIFLLEDTKFYLKTKAVQYGSGTEWMWRSCYSDLVTVLQTTVVKERWIKKLLNFRVALNEKSAWLR